MSTQIIAALTINVTGSEQDLSPPSNYKANCSRVTFVVENSGPGTASVKVCQSFFGTYWDDDAASVTTITVPPNQERSIVIDTSVREWYRLRASSSGGISNLRVAIAGLRAS